MKPPLKISPEVASALKEHRAVVGLETTILSFGLPNPRNLEVGRACEQIARGAGAVPATLGVANHQILVGLTDAELARFCGPDNGAKKVNLQNLTAVLHAGGMGALTVAASLQACSLTGISVFATGGIGGAHRDARETHDVSSDLIALSRYPVATVCAGIKSILDVPATLEHLETLGVPIIGYRASTLPLFHCRESSHSLDATFENFEEIAACLKIHFSVSQTGVLIVTPVPQEFAVDESELSGWIAEALFSAKRDEVRGKDVTPYLLKRLEQLSSGRTVDANAALIQNNAAVAAGIAVAISAEGRLS